MWGVSIILGRIIILRTDHNCVLVHSIRIEHHSGHVITILGMSTILCMIQVLRIGHHSVLVHNIGNLHHSGHDDNMGV